MKSLLEWAKLLEGREYGREISSDERDIAKENRIVIVFGGSDDLMEFAGAIYDEVDCFSGGIAYVTADGQLLENKCSEEDCPYFEKEKRMSTEIKAIWDHDGYSWVYETQIPHETFNIFEDVEDADTYCRGIVFSQDNLRL